jgi:hypothetical protein
MSNIAEVFEGLLAKHNLHVVSVGINTHCSDGAQWNATAHWEGFSRDGIACASGHAATPREAIEKAIRQSIVDRAPHEADVSVPALEVEQTA